MRYGDKTKEYSEGFRRTTNNRMELLAVIRALDKLKRYDIPVIVYSDSKYVIDSIEKGWVFNWVKTGFRGKKNEDLWRRYLDLHSKFDIEYSWVKGHAGHPENERCDVLATSATYNNIDTIYESL